MLDGAGVVLRVWRCAAVIAVCGMACAQGMQTASAEHQFEVASIRQVPEAERPSWMGTKLYPSGRLEISNVDVRELVYESFVSTDGPTRVVGGPKWLDSDKFDIAAKLDDEDAAGWAKLSEKERHRLNERRCGGCWKIDSTSRFTQKCGLNRFTPLSRRKEAQS